MALSCTLFLLLLSAVVVFGHLHPTETRRPGKGKPTEGRKALTGNRDRKQRSVTSQGNPEKMLKVLDFSADNNHEPDSNGEYTRATLEAGPLPESFTICSAFMVEAWTTEFSCADIFTLLDNDGNRWGSITLYAAASYTEYLVSLGPVHFINQTVTVFFPLQWSRVCLCLDSTAG